MSTPEIRELTLEEAQALWELGIPMHTKMVGQWQMRRNMSTSPTQDAEYENHNPRTMWKWGVEVE